MKKQRFSDTSAMPDVQYIYLLHKYQELNFNGVNERNIRINKQLIDGIDLVDFMYENNLLNYSWDEIISLYIIAGEFVASF
jgi:hypothetical protein